MKNVIGSIVSYEGNEGVVIDILNNYCYVKYFKSSIDKSKNREIIHDTELEPIDIMGRYIYIENPLEVYKVITYHYNGKLIINAKNISTNVLSTLIVDLKDTMNISILPKDYTPVKVEKEEKKMEEEKVKNTVEGKVTINNTDINFKFELVDFDSTKFLKLIGFINKIKGIQTDEDLISLINENKIVIKSDYVANLNLLSGYKMKTAVKEEIDVNKLINFISNFLKIIE